MNFLTRFYHASRTMSQIRHYSASSVSSTRKKVTIRTIRQLYESKTPIAVVTAYDYPTALHADRAGVDAVLVGDSLGMVVLGHETTQPVTLDSMIHHTSAARRGTSTSLLIADLPFGTYEVDDQDAARAAIRLVKQGGADVVKLEGGQSRTSAIRAIVNCGIAVVGHVGLLPQSVSTSGGFRPTAKDTQSACDVIKDAIAVEQAGAFAMVVECVPERVAQLITETVNIPTIGIGSGARCSGQVLVYHDMFGILSNQHHKKVAPRFSKQFTKVGELIDEGVREYCREVRERTFPSAKYSPYHIPDDDFEQVKQYVDNLKKKRSTTKNSTTEHNDEENVVVY